MQFNIQSTCLKQINKIRTKATVQGMENTIDVVKHGKPIIIHPLHLRLDKLVIRRFSSLDSSAVPRDSWCIARLGFMDVYGNYNIL